MFNFIVDPFRNINATDGAKYDGASFEEGSFFFKNTAGEFEYSTHSDKLNITNYSSVPLNATITLTAKKFANAQFSATTDFADDGAYIFLAIEDSNGNIIPVDENGIATINIEIPAAFQPSYSVVRDEETGDYYLEMDNFDGETVVNYWFSITGACNENDAWADITDSMEIDVSWSIEAMDEVSYEEVEIENPDAIEEEEETEEASTEGEAIGEVTESVEIELEELPVVEESEQVDASEPEETVMADSEANVEENEVNAIENTDGETAATEGEEAAPENVEGEVIEEQVQLEVIEEVLE